MKIYGPADKVEGILPFAEKVEDKSYLMTEKPVTMQVNVGWKCNLACKHCHVSGGPHREEVMSKETMEAILQVYKENDFQIMDITGGAPEMNPNLEWFIRESSKLGGTVMVRSNLCILDDPEYAHFIDVYDECGVDLVASLPYYNKRQLEKQRGVDTFESIIKILQELNSRGYGKEGSGKTLNLVYNPLGAIMAPTQGQIEPQFKKRLMDDFGIEFNNLFVITNNPIGRFGEFLERSGNLDMYINKLYAAYNPSAVPAMMCRTQLSVRWDGKLYDCDFNQPIDMEITTKKTIFDYVGTPIESRSIRVANHCYACVAGAGSSCGGTTAE